MNIATPRTILKEAFERIYQSIPYTKGVSSMNNNNTQEHQLWWNQCYRYWRWSCVGVGYAAFDLPPEPLMVLSTVIAALLVKRLGYGYNAILESISQKIAKTMPALLSFDQRGPTDWDMDDRRYYSADDLLRP